MKYRLTYSTYAHGTTYICRDKKEFSSHSDRKAREKARLWVKGKDTAIATHKLVNLVEIIKPATREKTKKIPFS